MLDNKTFDESLVKAGSPKPTARENSLGPVEGELRDLWQPEEEPQGNQNVAVEEQLCERGHVTAEQMQEARSIHSQTPRKRLGQILLEMGVVKEADLLACVAEQYELPFIRLDPEMADKQIFEILDRNFIESHNVLPLQIEDGKLVVALTDPTNVFLLDEIQRKTKKQLTVKVCPSEDIKNILATMDGTTTDFQVDEIIQDIGDEDVEIVDTKEDDLSSLEQAAGDSPIIKFVNYAIVKAVNDGASDIHIEPQEKKLKVRYRIDGVLFEMMSPPHHMHAAVVSRIKIMANMDIAERRLPQ
ncbi:MAG: Flp pilus assembly complex ATPase component TadA, partial [Sedimentisphaerales bacterium]|nr:Flp pilus assembly complex ATPase component TadA [Sedimentisphaerales bacterium]